MPKAKCPKKQKANTDVNISTQEIKSSSSGITVLFEHNVQIWKNTYKKGQVEVFDKIEWFERFVSVVK